MTEREKVIEDLKELRSYFRAMSGISTSKEGRQNHMKSARMIDDALALLKAQEPRVMTLWEAVGIIDRPVYLERNVLMPDKSVNRQECWALVCATDDEHMIRLATPYGEEKWHVGAYGIGWRCWTSRPDEKRRAETPWN